jgi:hypothetical protein
MTCTHPYTDLRRKQTTPGRSTFAQATRSHKESPWVSWTTALSVIRNNDLVGYDKRLCNTCYSTSHFSDYTMRVARVESQILTYTTTEMREHFSKYYSPRTNFRREIHMFLSVTSLPLFPMMCGTFLDIQSALSLTQSCRNCQSTSNTCFTTQACTHPYTDLRRKQTTPGRITFAQATRSHKELPWASWTTALSVIRNNDLPR